VLSFSDQTEIYAITDTNTRLQTDFANNLMVGYYVDPIFGSVNCGFVSEFDLTTSGKIFNEGDVVLEATNLSLTFAFIEFYGNDSDLSNVTFDVYELTDTLPEDIFSDYAPVYDPTPLATVSFTQNDTVSETIDGKPVYTFTVDLPLSLGDKILASDTIIDNDHLHEIIKGLYFKADTSISNAVASFGINLNNTTFTTTLDLQYKADTTYDSYTFIMNHETANANLIQKNKPSAIVDTAGINDRFYVQAGGGYYNVIQLPGFDSWIEDSSDIAITKAVLTITVDSMTSPELYSPPANLIPYHFDSNLDPISDYQGEDVTYGSSLGLEIDGEYNATTLSYSFNITRYLQLLLLGEIENEGIYFLPSEISSSIRRVVLCNASSDTNPLKLEITYHKIQ
jgi:hypothetical protein